LPRQHRPNERSAAASKRFTNIMNKLVLAMACLAYASAIPLKLDGGSFFPGSGRQIGGGGQFISSGGDIVGDNYDGNFDSGNFISGDSGNFVSGGSSGGFSSGGFSSGGSSGGFVSGGSSGSSGSGDSRLSSISLDAGCSNGQVKNYNGQCITPEVSRNMFLYEVAPQQIRTNPARNIPNPKVHLNYVFVRHEQNHGSAQPIVVTPKQKTIVYVLKKNADDINQQVIEVPHEPVNPEVFVVNYDEGDNKQLPGGISLQEALSQSLQNARVIDASEGGSSGSDGAGQLNLRSEGFSQGSSGGSFSQGSSGSSFSQGSSSGGSFSQGSSSGGSFNQGSFGGRSLGSLDDDVL